MLKLIGPILAALKAGQELKNPVAWKKGQNLLNSCALVITGIVAFLRWQYPNLPVTDEQILEMASIAAAILALLNRYITTASTKKIGVGHVESTSDSPVDSSSH
jgi:hypothetical protein